LPFFHRHSPNTLAQNSVAGSLVPHKFGFFKTPVRALVVRCFPCLRGEALRNNRPPRRNKARPVNPKP
jgi:hypothetical protein